LPAEDEVLNATPEQMFQRGNAALTAFYSVANTELGSLGGRLDDRLAQLRFQLALAGALLGLGFLIAFSLAFLVARGMTQQLGAITDALTQIGIGNFDARVEILSNDELGIVARSMNGMLGNTLALIQSREERDAQQTSIMKLLDEVSGVAEGDLTRDAEVTPEITGAIADAFNFMLGELRRLVGNVQVTAAQVGDAADQIQGSTENLAAGSDAQNRRINEASEAIRGMTTSIQQVSADAAQAAEVARRSLTGALRGARAVTQTAEGMNNVRQEVQETSKRIKRLGESSQEIGEIAKLINEIADRTGMLALNASIQAASAGEAGRGFAVVAAEVERLAVRAADATKRIDELIGTIQGETSEVIVAMEETTREVVEGSSLATEAGETLTEIERVSKELASLVQGISDASADQKRTSEVVARSMEEISDISQQTAAGSRDSAASVKGLASLVARLRDSVRTFKLPASS
jgi:twitching motility protein PilJ